MEKGNPEKEHDRLNERPVVLLCHDHDMRRLESFVYRGGRVMGWVDGMYRVLMPGRPHG